MKVKRLFLIALLICTLSPISSQSLQEGKKLWSEENVLVDVDFIIRIDARNNEALHSQFAMTYQVGGRFF